MTGHSVEEMLSGSSLMHWAQPEQRNIYKEILSRDKHVKNFEAKIIKKGGEIRTLLLSARLYPEYGYIEGSAVDITALRLAEEELHLKDFVFKASLTADSIGSNDGLLTHVNQSFLQIWGYDSNEEVIGKPISDFIAEQEKVPEILESLTRKGTWEGEYLARKKDGSTFVAQSKANVVLGADGKQIALYSSVIDITEKKRAEAGLKKVSLDLTRSNQDLEQFAYIASHDLQEPLRMVSSYVKLLERRYKGKLDADADDFINFAVDGAVRMQNLINDLLLFSRVNTRGKEFELTDYEAVFATVVGNLQAQIESNKAILTHDPLPKAWADSVQQIQVMQNLIHNGIKFHRDEAPRVHVSAKEGDDEWVFSVKDNGIGIEPEYFDRIFLIFHRLNEKDKYPGTGIGLSICKKIIERHGGRIWIESEPGKGSAFFFTIPKNMKEKGEKNEGLIYEFK
jgi:PAS domain S-box-containing protein